MRTHFCNNKQIFQTKNTEEYSVTRQFTKNDNGFLYQFNGFLYQVSIVSRSFNRICTRKPWRSVYVEETDIHHAEQLSLRVKAPIVFETNKFWACKWLSPSTERGNEPREKVDIGPSSSVSVTVPNGHIIIPCPWTIWMRNCHRTFKFCNFGDFMKKNQDSVTTVRNSDWLFWNSLMNSTTERYNGIFNKSIRNSVYNWFWEIYILCPERSSVFTSYVYKIFKIPGKPTAARNKRRMFQTCSIFSMLFHIPWCIHSPP